MITYIIPTRNRPEQLAQTLEAIDRLGDHGSGAEVIVADNASDPPAWTPQWLGSGAPVKLMRRDRNEAAAARNAAAREASEDSTWLVMLDDDSHPLDARFIEALSEMPGDVGAVAAEVFVPGGEMPAITLGMGVDARDFASSLAAPTRHESGGLPEVFVGCGVALRRDLFLRLGGYDATFDYYAEEYDLAARMIAAGFRVLFDRRFRVLHRKVTTGRDFGRIIRRLVRNNAWVAQRYAPTDARLGELRETITRYAGIAWKEGVSSSYLRGVWELAGTLSRQPRTPLEPAHWDRLTGLHHARVALAAADAQQPLGRVALVDRGKNAWAAEKALAELGVRVIPDERGADTLVIGTMSPGPMLDALTTWTRLGRRVVAPWVEARDIVRTPHGRMLVA
ncbi:MAG: glycosyltransferase family 2 protein [Phycisphaerales bacterium]